MQIIFFLKWKKNEIRGISMEKKLYWGTQQTEKKKIKKIKKGPLILKRKK